MTAGRGLSEGFSSQQAITFTRRMLDLSLIEQRLSGLTAFGPSLVTAFLGRILI
jgi:hypothetical protein